MPAHTSMVARASVQTADLRPAGGVQETAVPAVSVEKQHALWDWLKGAKPYEPFTCLDMQGRPHLWCETLATKKPDVVRFEVINGAWTGTLTKTEDGIWLGVDKYPENSWTTMLAKWSDPSQLQYMPTRRGRIAQQARQADEDEIPF